jgi:predicted MPP superfamily phosphohydrolase
MIANRRFVRAARTLAALLVVAIAPCRLRAEDGGVTFFGWSDQHVQTSGDGKHLLPAIDAINSLPGTKYPTATGGAVATPAFVLGCGDITDWPSAAARDTYNELLTRRLKFPAYDVLGNHDEGGDAPNEIMKTWFRARYGGLSYTFDRGGIRFIVLYSRYDESLKNPAQPVAADALAFLRKELAKLAKGAPVVVALHLCADAITNRDEFVDALGDANVLLVLSGHYHKAKVQRFRSVNFVQFPSPAVNLVRDPPPPNPGPAEVTVIRITSDRLLVLPYDYKTKTWSDKPDKMLDVPIRGAVKENEADKPVPAGGQQEPSPKEPPAKGNAVDEFRGLPDNRIAVRTSLGLRTAQATDGSHVQIVLGMSVTRACARPASYRILSFQDDRYAYRVAETAYPPNQPKFASLQTFVDCHFAIGMDEGLVSTQAKSMAAFGLLLPDRKK